MSQSLPRARPGVYFSPQDQVLKQIKASIDEASRSLDLVMYIFSTAYLAKALVNAHRRGVAVGSWEV